MALSLGGDPSAHATLLLSDDDWLAVLYGEYSPLALALCNTVRRIVTTNGSVHRYELDSSLRWPDRWRPKRKYPQTARMET